MLLLAPLRPPESQRARGRPACQVEVKRDQNPSHQLMSFSRRACEPRQEYDSYDLIEAFGLEP